MEVVIRAEAKEIAALIVELQERREILLKQELDEELLYSSPPGGFLDCGLDQRLKSE